MLQLNREKRFLKEIRRVVFDSLFASRISCDNNDVRIFSKWKVPNIFQKFTEDLHTSTLFHSANRSYGITYYVKKGGPLL